MTMMEASRTYTMELLALMLDYCCILYVTDILFSLLTVSAYSCCIFVNLAISTSSMVSFIMVC